MRLKFPSIEHGEFTNSYISWHMDGGGVALSKVMDEGQKTLTRAKVDARALLPRKLIFWVWLLRARE